LLLFLQKKNNLLFLKKKKQKNFYDFAPLTGIGSRPRNGVKPKNKSLLASFPKKNEESLFSNFDVENLVLTARHRLAGKAVSH
jgi:hypothetical protein